MLVLLLGIIAMSLNEVKSAWLQQVVLYNLVFFLMIINFWDYCLQGRDFVCPEDGFWPSSTDCCSNLYYACLGGVAYEEVIFFCMLLIILY